MYSCIDKKCCICGTRNNLIKFSSVCVCEKCVIKKLYTYKNTQQNYVIDRNKDKVLR